MACHDTSNAEESKIDGPSDTKKSHQAGGCCAGTNAAEESRQTELCCSGGACGSISSTDKAEKGLRGTPGGPVLQRRGCTSRLGEVMKDVVLEEQPAQDAEETNDAEKMKLVDHAEPACWKCWKRPEEQEMSREVKMDATSRSAVLEDSSSSATCFSSGCTSSPLSCCGHTGDDEKPPSRPHHTIPKTKKDSTSSTTCCSSGCATSPFNYCGRTGDDEQPPPSPPHSTNPKRAITFEEDAKMRLGKKNGDTTCEKLYAAGTKATLASNLTSDAFAHSWSREAAKRSELRANKLLLDGVHYSDPEVDQDAWLQFVGNVMWPFIQKAVETFLLTELQENIRAECADLPLLANFTFTHCDFGEKKPKFEPLITRNKDDGVELDIRLDWPLDEKASIEVSVGGIRAGMRDIHIKCSVLLLFQPLLKVLPITGGLCISFPNSPDLSFKWTGVGRAFPSKMVHAAIIKSLNDAIVVPNRIFVNIAENSGIVDKDHLPQAFEYQTPPPVGILRIEVLEARDLPPANWRTSDPYIVVQVGGAEYTTRTIHRTLDPKWSSEEGYDFLVYHSQQQVSITVFDAEIFVKDDKIGYIFKPDRNDDEDEWWRCQKRPRPTVEDLVDNPYDMWPVDIRCCGFDEGKYQPKVKLKCEFLKVESNSTKHTVKPKLINCPERCSSKLIEDDGKKSMNCALCNRGVSTTWKERLISRKRPKGWVCHDCKFGLCSDCWLFKRPACGLLRITLRSAKVPLSHAKATSVVSFEFEGLSHKSKASKLPYELALTWTEKVDTVHNLVWHANLENDMVARCLGIPIEEVEHLLSKKPSEDALLSPHEPKKDQDSSGRTTVLWNEAFHFLVRDPSASSCIVNITYRSTGMNSSFLSGSKGKLSAKLSLWDCSARKQKCKSEWLNPFEVEEVQCPVKSEDNTEAAKLRRAQTPMKDHHSSAAALSPILFLDVQFDPITAVGLATLNSRSRMGTAGCRASMALFGTALSVYTDA